jgi:hypothetical protein
VQHATRLQVPQLFHLHGGADRGADAYRHEREGHDAHVPCVRAPEDALHDDTERESGCRSEHGPDAHAPGDAPGHQQLEASVAGADREADRQLLPHLAKRLRQGGVQPTPHEHESADACRHDETNDQRHDEPAHDPPD